MELSKQTLKAFNPAVDKSASELEGLVTRMMEHHAETWRGVLWVTMRHGTNEGVDFLNNARLDDAYLLADVWDTLYPMALELTRKNVGLTMDKAVMQVVMNQHNYAAGQLPPAPGMGIENKTQ